MYDVIGDVHGQADALKALLAKLGYAQEDGVYRHPTRTAVFVGDLIDRGPKIREVLETVQAMVEAGAARAVMGNHELNALLFHTKKEEDSYLRPRTYKNIRQCRETIGQLSDAALDGYVEWFRTLPMWLDLGGLRVVHACWDEPSLCLVAPHWGEDQRWSDTFLRAASVEGSTLRAAVETLLKGKEADLPEGLAFFDKDGHERRQVRTRWYEDARKTPRLSWRDYAFCFKDAERDALPAEELPDAVCMDAGYPSGAPPVLFGHYWVPGEEDWMKPLACNVACVDFSAGRGGRLGAYRWDGEVALSEDKFVTVSVG